MFPHRLLYGMKVVSRAGRFCNEGGSEYCLGARLSIRCSGQYSDCTASNIPPSLSPPRSFSLSSFCSVGQSSLRTPTFMFPVVSSLPCEGNIHYFSGISVVELSFRYVIVRSHCIRNPLSHCSLKLQYAASAIHVEDVTCRLSEFTHV